MIRKIFKKRKDNQNRNKPSCRKRKIFATIALALSLLFGKQRLSPYRPSSPNFGNQASPEKLIDNQEFNSLDRNNRQVILAKAEGNLSTPSTQELDFLEKDSKYIILVKDYKSNFFTEAFPTSPSPKWPSSTGRTIPTSGSGSNPGPGGGNSASYNQTCSANPFSLENPKTPTIVHGVVGVPKGKTEKVCKA